MKILMVNGHLKLGGVEKSLVDLLKSIDYHKHQVDLLLFEGTGEYLADIPLDVNVISCDLRPTFGAFKNTMLSFWKKKDFRNMLIKMILTLKSRFSIKFIKLFRLLKITDSKYDCAIAYRVGICNEYVSFCVSAKQKYMWWHHGSFEYEDSVVKQWKCALKNIDKIVCVSEATKEMIRPFFPEKKKDICVLPNMIISDEIIAKGNMFHPYVVEKDIIKMVSVGRLSPEKKMINTVYAMEELLSAGYKNVRWYLVGDGVERETIENEIVKRNLQEYIYCVGNQSNPYPYMKDADLYVHPSYVESQGLTILEAMTLGVPCVVTKSKGPCEFVEDGENGLLVEKSPEALANGVLRMLTDDKLLGKIKNNTKCPKQFRQDLVMQQFENLISLKNKKRVDI